MDNLSYDDDGIPALGLTTVTELPSASLLSKTTSNNSSRPTVTTHATRPSGAPENYRPKPSTSRSPYSEHRTFNMPTNIRPSYQEETYTGIFSIDGHSYDVNLTDKKITWSSISGTSKVPKSLKSKNSIFRRKKSGPDSGKHVDEQNTILMQDIIGIRIKRERKATQKEGEGVCQGIGVYTYLRKDYTKLRDRLVLLGNPSEEICVRWCRKIYAALQKFTERPKKVKVLLQPFSGKKFSRWVYGNKIKPLFEAAGIDSDVTDIVHTEHIKQTMIHLRMSDYDSIVCVGGDGTVNKVVNGMLNNAQKDMNVTMKPGVTPVKAGITLGIIPTGTTNHIVHSVQGIDDVTTATLHIILGHSRPVDVCSVYDKDHFHSWGFNSHYGFFGNLLKYMTRYTLLGEKKTEASFMKALTKSKFRSFECEIKYLPNPVSSSHPVDGVQCRRGCAVCWVDEGCRGCTYTDQVETLQPLEGSANSSNFADFSKEDPWQTVKGEYVSVSVLSIPALSNLAPLGMSPCSHSADGCLDLVMVQNTDRKEFVRYLKRHGNSKNQLKLPFVEPKRCKGVHITIPKHNTWQHKDVGYNEIDDEVRRQEQTASKRNINTELTIDLEDSSDDEEVQVLHILDSDGDDDNTLDDISNSAKHLRGEISDKPRIANGESWKPPARPTMGWTNGEDFTKDNKDNSQQTKTNAFDDFNSSPTEVERVKHKKNQKKKDKNKSKDDKDTNALWNIDNELSIELDLQFLVHSGLLRIHGSGVPPEYQPDDVTYGCLSVF